MSVILIKKDYGIYETNVDGIPEYPIAYLRLCYNFYTNEYCVAEDCNISGEFSRRKFIVVGIRLGKEIFEQAFYLSSGLNSIESMERFFKTKLNSTITDLWIPFCGIGFEDRKTYTIKLIKDGFGCLDKSPECLYGRFGVSDPNLIQISYCLGGFFWKNNVNLINEISGFDIKKYPMINVESLPCSFVYVGGDGYKVDEYACGVYINNYIGSAIPMNYQTVSLKWKKQLLSHHILGRVFKKYENVKADYRIFSLMYELYGVKGTKGMMKDHLPIETIIYTSMFWNNYYSLLSEMEKEDPKYYKKYVLPIINETIPNTEIEMNNAEYNKWARESEVVKPKVSFKKEVEILPVKKELKEIVFAPPLLEKKGTKENPHSSRGDADIGEYYFHGAASVRQRKK
jgi:hypothetical protein